MSNLTDEQVKALNDWARTQPALRRVFPYTKGSEVDTLGLGAALDTDGVSTITVRESDGSPTFTTSELIVDSEAFYLSPNSAGKPTLSFRPAAAGVITDHGALTGLGDNDHPQYLLASEAGLFYGIVVKESDGTFVERDDTIEFLSTDFDLSTVDGKPRVALGKIHTAEAFYLSPDGSGESQEFSTDGLITHRAHIHDYLDLDATTDPATPTSNVARLWSVNDAGHSILRYKDNDGIIFEVLQDQILIARNTTGVTITAGKLVYISGSSGDRPNIALADADSESTMPVIGITTASIAHNAYGVILVHGSWTGAIDLSSFADGDALYASGTAGAVTNVKPTYPQIDQPIGYVVNNVATGTIFINPGGIDEHIEEITDGTNVYNDHPRRLSFNANQFYLSGDLSGEPVVNLKHEVFTKSITLQNPSNADTITWWKEPEETVVLAMDAFLRTEDSGFYPFADFTIRHRVGIPARNSGTELKVGGWRVGFYTGHAATGENPLVRDSFDNPTIGENSYVWLETTKLGEGNGIEEELHVTLKLRH